MTDNDKALVEWLRNCSIYEGRAFLKKAADRIETLNAMLAAAEECLGDQLAARKEQADRIDALLAEIERLKRDHASAVAELNKTKALLKGYRRGFKNARKGATE